MNRILLMNHPTLELAAAALVTALAVTSCVNAPKASQTSYQTLTIKRQELNAPVKWSASVVGKNDVKISPRTSGQLEKVCVKEGERVTVGQTLFKIDSRQAQLALTAARADLFAAQAQCSTAELEYKSNTRLYEKHIVSDYMLNSALNDYKRAQAAVDQAKAGLSNAEMELEWCTVTSPVAGIIGGIPNNPGDQVSEQTVLTTVAGDNVMTARFSITETQLQNVLSEYGPIEKALEGLPDVSLQLKDGSIHPYKGRLVSISGVVDRNTGSVVCRADFPNPDGMLYSGIQGNVVMELNYGDEIVIPITALVRLQDKSLVYKVKNNIAESVIVEAEPLGDGKRVVVLAGLEEGDVIVSVGAANVYDGQQVIFPGSPVADK